MTRLYLLCKLKYCEGFWLAAAPSINSNPITRPSLSERGHGLQPCESFSPAETGSVKQPRVCCCCFRPCKKKKKDVLKRFSQFGEKWWMVWHFGGFLFQRYAPLLHSWMPDITGTKWEECDRTLQVGNREKTHSGWIIKLPLPDLFSGSPAAACNAVASIYHCASQNILEHNVSC